MYVIYCGVCCFLHRISDYPTKLLTVVEAYPVCFLVIWLNDYNDGKVNAAGWLARIIRPAGR